MWSATSWPNPLAVSFTTAMRAPYSSRVSPSVAISRWNLATTPDRARPGALLAPPRFPGAVEGRGTDVAQLATLAGGSAPDAIEELLHAVQQTLVRAREAELEVAPPRPLRAQAGARPVGAADVDEG